MAEEYRQQLSDKTIYLEGRNVARWQNYAGKALLRPDEGDIFLQDWLSAAKRGSLQAFGNTLPDPPWKSQERETIHVYRGSDRAGIRNTTAETEISVRALPKEYADRINDLLIIVGYCTDSSEPLHGDIRLRAGRPDILQNPLVLRMLNVLGATVIEKPEKYNYSEHLIDGYEHAPFSRDAMTSNLAWTINNILGIDHRLYFFDPQLQHATWEAFNLIRQLNVLGEVPKPSGPRMMVVDRTGGHTYQSSRYYRESDDLLDQDKMRSSFPYGKKLQAAGIPLAYSYFHPAYIERKILEALGKRGLVKGVRKLQHNVMQNQKLLRSIFENMHESETLVAQYPTTTVALEFITTGLVRYATDKVMTWQQFHDALAGVLPGFVPDLNQGARSDSEAAVNGVYPNFAIADTKSKFGIHFAYSVSSSRCTNHPLTS